MGQTRDPDQKNSETIKAFVCKPRTTRAEALSDEVATLTNGALSLGPSVSPSSMPFRLGKARASPVPSGSERGAGNTELTR